MGKKSRVFGGYFFTMACLTFLLLVDGQGEATRVSIGDGIQTSGFTQDTAIHGNTFVASALDSDMNGTAYVFVRFTTTQWLPQGELKPVDMQDPQPSDAFGRCVGIHGDTAIVGDPRTTVNGFENAGTVYVFNRDETGTWKETTRLHPNESTTNGFFGSACEIDDETIVVGEPSLDSLGKAYVFDNIESSGWQLTTELVPDMGTFECFDSIQGFRLGSYVSYKAGTAVISPSSSDNCRRVFVFERQAAGNWAQVEQLGENGACDYAVSVGQLDLAIGDPCASVGNTEDSEDLIEEAGQVAMYRKTRNNVWQIAEVIQVTEPVQNDHFGRDVAVEGTGILASRPGDNDKMGGAFLFRIDGNSYELEATLSGGYNGGQSVALMGYDYAIVSSSLNQQYETQEDSIYVFATNAILGGGASPSETQSTPAPSPATAQPTPEVQRAWEKQPPLILDEAVARSRFGSRVAIDGETIVVSTVDDNVYVFSKVDDDWVPQHVRPEDVEAKSLFGSCIGISEDWIVVGASRHSGNSGRLYIFNKDGENEWILHSTVEAEDESLRDGLGSACAISGETIAVGAPTADAEDTTNLGIVLIYVLEGNTWNFQNRIVPSLDGACSGEMTDHRFGNDLALSGDTLAVVPFPPPGSCHRVYIFERVGQLWPQIAELGSEDGDCTFDVSLDTSGNALAIGDSCHSTDSADEIGQVTIYRKNSTQEWTAGEVISPPFPLANDRFGFGVSLNGDAVLIGRPREESSGAFVYFRSAVNESEWENAAFLEGGENAGGQVALLGDFAIIGSPNDDQIGKTNTGSVRIYQYNNLA